MAILDDEATQLHAVRFADLAWIVPLLTLALAARLAWSSGYGLNDDNLLRNDISHILHSHAIPVGPNSYRFTWWIPTAVSCRLLGITELGLIAPITVFATLGLGLVAVLGTMLHGRAGGVLATLLVAVTPLDFAWSTMLTSDVILSACLALMMLLVVQGLRLAHGIPALLCWLLAGVAFWLGLHAKLSAPTVLPAIAVVLWRNRHELSRESLAFPVTAGLLVLVTATWNYVFWGDPFDPLQKELVAQGLSGPQVGPEHRIIAGTFEVYPRLLFLPNQLGNMVFGLEPHLLAALLLAAPLVGLRTTSLGLWWLVFLFLGMELNVQRAGGSWVAGFRNIRHAHPLVYPLVLTLVGLVLSLRRRWPRVAALAIGVTLVVGAWQSVSTAARTHEVFADRRRAVQFLTTLPPKTIYADFQLGDSLALAEPPDPPWRVQHVHPFDRVRQKAELDAVKDGYLVTGGGREPYYGCFDCIPRAQEVSPDRWRLLVELPGPVPPVPWRREPLRIWEATGGR